MDPKALRVAATLLLVRDDPLEVLMVRRHAKATFASNLVFPGGVLEPEDADEAWLPLLTGAESLEPAERALRICAIRETWEETALLVGSDTAPTAMEGRSLRELIADNGIRLSLDSLHRFGHWITPEGNPRRFDTHFYLARVPRDQHPVVDGGEIVELEWRSPAAPKDPTVRFPTAMNLRRLAESADLDTAIEAAAARPHYTVRPVRVMREDGTSVATIPLEAGYGVTESEE